MSLTKRIEGFVVNNLSSLQLVDGTTWSFENILQDRYTLTKAQFKMSGISSDVLGQIILKTYRNFPDLFSRNYTLAEIFTAVRYNTTILSTIANTTGVDEKVIQHTVDVYLAITEYMKPAREPPRVNATNE